MKYCLEFFVFSCLYLVDLIFWFSTDLVLETDFHTFDENLSNELITRAKTHLNKVREENLELLKKEGVEQYLLDSKMLGIEHLMKLSENKIKTRDQLADLSNDELIDLLGNIEKEKADEIIIDARKHWF